MLLILQGFRRGDMLYQKDMLSPPNSVARISDSDMSEFDIDDGISSVTGLFYFFASSVFFSVGLRF